MVSLGAMVKLIGCRACGNQISKDASACPRCGAPPKRHDALKVVVVGVGVVFVATVIASELGAGYRPDMAGSSKVADPDPVAVPPPRPAPPPKPTFDRTTLISVLGSISNGCIELEPTVQFLDDNVVRIQYIHGCGEFEKPDAGKVMWRILGQAVALARTAGAEMPTFKIQAFTRNGSSLFTSITSPQNITKLLDKEIGFDDWLVRVGEGPRKLAAGRSEADYLKALPEPPAGAKVPEGDDIKADLIAYIEDLECAGDVSKLVLGKVVALGYQEACGHFEHGDVRLTMYEIAVRMIMQFDKHSVWAGLAITARTDNGGYVFTQTVPAQILQGIKDRQVGIVDWITRSYAGGKYEH
jgi:hypothetical protein